jgi:hypothetical protein
MGKNVGITSEGIGEVKTQVSFLPYITIDQDIQFGDFIFWNYYEKSQSILTNHDIRSHLNRIFSQYVRNGRPREKEEITIASYRGYNNFDPLLEDQRTLLNGIVDILCFCSIINTNRYVLITRDNFMLYTQNFRAGSKYIAPFSGSYKEIPRGGYEIKDVAFITPLYISSGKINCHKKLFSSFERMCTDKSKEKLFRRLVRSLEWANFAHTNQEIFKFETRITLMSIAFETLLNPFRRKWDFIEKLKNYVDDYGNTVQGRPSLSNEKGTGVLIPNATLIQVWGYDFYNLRSSIAHNLKVPPTKDLMKQFDQSLWVFLECLKKVLEKNGFYNYDSSDRFDWMGQIREHFTLHPYGQHPHSRRPRGRGESHL